MVIHTFYDVTGSIILQWHIKQALHQFKTVERDAKIISVASSTCPSEHLTRSERAVSQITSSEVGEALKKVLIKKQHKNDPSTQLTNLNRVSALCPVLNLRKNS
jgi:hypothetical protein